MKVYRVEPDKGLNKCTEKHIQDILVWFEESEPGSVITIEVLEMSEDDYDALPEYMGP